MKVSNHSDSAPPESSQPRGATETFFKKSVFSCNSTAVTLPLHRSGPEINRWCHGVRKLKLIFFKKKSSFSFGLPFPSESSLASSPLCISASNLAAPGHGQRWKVPPRRAYYRSDSPGRKPRRIQRAAISDAEPAAGEREGENGVRMEGRVDV